MRTQNVTRQAFATIERLRGLAWALAVYLGLYGFALAPSARAASDGAFKTPSGNILCLLTEADAECVIKSGLNPPPPRPRACDGGDPVSNRVSLLANGIAAPIPCAGDPGPMVYEAEAKELPEGSTLVKGEIGCAVFKFGLVCANNKGHGFFLSRAAAHYF